MLVAVYGTLKRGRGNHSVLGASEFIGEGYIHGHRMYQAGIPFVVQDYSSDYPVLVEVYNVSREQLPYVDSLEGHPRWYRRIQTEVTLQDGEILEAWVYKVPSPPDYTEENKTGVY